MAAPDELDLSISDSGALDRASAALTDADERLPADILREVRQVAARLANIARARALAEPTFGPKHTGLRAQVAAGVGVSETELGAKVTTSMPQANEAVIPRGLDQNGWRHPVFGNKSRWVVQHGAFSWFMDSMQGGRSDGEQNLERLLEETAERIAAAT